ncbi:unnamed protein product [Chilo suppressalis]|uniref:VWFA domain-containing protein n=1 Tax=Chilo suppressalis TaxID=168631 RepID=A0ABN8B7Z0_CHISP|nr:unnamed protein product [Chilo suppressalis]
MASERRTLLLALVLVCVIKTNLSDSDFSAPGNETDDNNYDAIDAQVTKPKDIEPERSLRHDEQENESENERISTVEDFTTTAAPEVEGNVNDDTPKTDEDIEGDSRNAVTVDVTEPVLATLSNVDNNVYKQVNGVSEDIYLNRSNNGKGQGDSTAPPPTSPMDASEDFVPRIAELSDDFDIQGQRNPKTDNSESIPNEQRNFDLKPRPSQAVSKSSTLKSWLEDSWIRPPVGLLVPLRPMALNRALAVWNDLTVGGLNVSDIVIVGYDSNGVNWRSRHNLQPSNAGNGDRAVSEALSKLLLKYQGVNADAGDSTMRALASAAKLVPYDSALFVLTDRGAADPQRLPLALRALVEKRLKVYTIWTDPNHPSADSEDALHELRNVSTHTEGEVLPYSLQVMDMDASNLASEPDLQDWEEVHNMQARRGRLNPEVDHERFETLLVRRGGGEAISLGVPIENGVTALKIYIEGAVEHAVLYPPNDAPQIDLYNKTSVAAFSPASKTIGLNPRDVLLVFPGAKTGDDLAVMPASPPVSDAGLVGVWHLSIRCDTCDYRLGIAARGQLHFDVEEEKPDKLKFRISGPVSSVRESILIDEYGTELAKLAFNYPPMSQSSGNALTADVQLPNDVRGPRVYAKIEGRDDRGEPFVRLFGPLSYQSEVRTSRSAALRFPDSTNDLELAEEMNLRAHSQRQLQYNDSNVIPYDRAVSQVVNQLGAILTAVQIGLSTRLYGAPRDSLQLHFEVTNFREQSVNFRFGAVGEQRFLTGISPTQRTIASGRTENVIVSVTIPNSAQPGARDFITFTAYGLEQVSISAYVYVINAGQTPVDTWSPELRHEFQGSCIGRTGDDCSQHVWSATISARDTGSGLLRLTSSPIGLIYDSSFVSGTREQVTGIYRATCCAPRVVVNAVDALGNTNSYVVDISGYISGAGIAAIVLGVILAIGLIALLVFAIAFCVRRRRESRELPSYATSSRN